MGSTCCDLIIHPETPSEAVGGIVVELTLNGTDMWIRYVVDANTDKLALTAPTHSNRTDNLWKLTCFEAFFFINEGPAYVELNFSPSSQWAAYGFTHYRKGMMDFPLAKDPQIDSNARASQFALEACLSLSVDIKVGKIALSAVIEEQDGTKSYWALRHPLGAPDFHHKDCFALSLPAPELT